MKKIFTLITLIAFTLSTSFAQTAPDFTFTDTNGDSHTLSEALAEGKVILLDFFFVDCPPCNTWAPELEQIVEDYQGTTLEVWAMSDRDSDAYLSSSIFASSHENHKVGGSEGGGAEVVNLFSNNFNFTGFPTYAIVCNDNSITWDVWPISAGANEIRAYLTEDCGVTDLAPPSAISTIEGLNNTQVYPNPATDRVSLAFDLDQSTNIEVELYNTLGQVVKSIPATEYSTGNQVITFDVNTLSKGIYVLKMQSEKGLQSVELAIK